MENSKNQNCLGLPHFCSAGLQAPKVAVKPEIKMPASRTSTQANTNQKPWSVFGELYWI